MTVWTRMAVATQKNVRVLAQAHTAGRWHLTRIPRRQPSSHSRSLSKKHRTLEFGAFPPAAAGSRREVPRAWCPCSPSQETGRSDESGPKGDFLPPVLTAALVTPPRAVSGINNSSAFNWKERTSSFHLSATFAAAARRASPCVPFTTSPPFLPPPSPPPS